MKLAPSKQIQIRLSEELRDALYAFCEQHQLERSELIREALAKHIGREDLLKTVRREGRPPRANTADE